MTAQLSSSKQPLLLATFLLIFCRVTSQPQVDIQNLRNSICNNVNVVDNKYNQTMVYYYRITRSNLFQSNYPSAFTYYSSSNPIDFISVIKWPFGVVLAFTIFILLSALFFAVMFKFHTQKERHQKLVKLFSLSVLIGTLCLIGLFVVQIIFIAMSEVSKKRALCQILNIGNMIVNGYSNPNSGDKYMGIQTLAKGIASIKSEYVNLVNAATNAQNIINQNLPVAAQAAVGTIQAVAMQYSPVVTTDSYGRPTQSYSFSSIGKYLSVSAQNEFLYINTLANNMANSAFSVAKLTDPNNSNLANEMVTGTNSLLAFYASFTNDLVTTINTVYNTANARINKGRGGYWTMFCISIIIIVLMGFMLVKIVGEIEVERNYSSYTGFKVCLVVVALLVCAYGAMVIITMSESGSISTFCKVLGQINNQDPTILNQISGPWQGLSKYTFKECAYGRNGNLWNFYQTWPNATFTPHVSDILNIFSGIVDYNAFAVYPSNFTSASLSTLMANYTLIMSGIITDVLGVSDQLQILQNLTASSGISIGLSQPSCPSNTSLNCTAIDANAVFLISNATANYTLIQVIFNNLKSYIGSEQASLTALVNSLTSNAGASLSPSTAFQNVKSSVIQIGPSMAAIAAQLPLTNAVFQNFSGSFEQINDCRRVQGELQILEDHACFELNYFIFVLLVLMGVSFALMVIMSWFFFAILSQYSISIRESRMIAPLLDTRDNVEQKELASDINQIENSPGF